MRAVGLVFTAMISVAGALVVPSPAGALLGGGGNTERVSVADDGTPANAPAVGGKTNGDGRLVAFSTEADNVVAGDTNGVEDVFVHDRRSKTTRRVSVSSSGEPGNGPSYGSALSRNGRWVLFNTKATNLVPDDANGPATDVVLFDLATGALTRESVGEDGTQPTSGADQQGISHDGCQLVFASRSDGVVPGDEDGLRDVFVRDRCAGRTVAISEWPGSDIAGEAIDARITSDGRWVVVRSTGSSGNTDLWRHDRDADADGIFDEAEPGAVTSESLDLVPDGPTGLGWLSVAAFDLSDDGQFLSYDIHRPGPHGLTVRGELFLRHLPSGQTQSYVEEEWGYENVGTIAHDLSFTGRFLVYRASNSKLVGLRSGYDVFLIDFWTNDVEQISVTLLGADASGSSSPGMVSNDGRYVSFVSTADNLDLSGAVDTGTAQAIYVRDRGPSAVEG